MKLDLRDMMQRYCAYGWRQSAICRKWGISTKTLHNIEGCTSLRHPPRRMALNAITPAEKAAVIEYAVKHTELGHREMCYRMIDEDVAFMSPSSVYRILSERQLVAPRNGRRQPRDWDPHQQPGRADEIWQTDLMVIRYKNRDYFLLSYIDTYSRFITYHKLCTSMTGDTIKEATRQHLADCRRRPDNIQSDNGSCYISQEYRSYLSKNEIEHRRIHPYCPNENAEIERYHRTMRELIDPEDADNFAQLDELINEQIYYYNHIRYHSAIGFVTPYARYYGKDEAILKKRERKLAKAREKRIKHNLARIRKQAA